ncbi:MAG: LLM class flavin-dependent oxidoreductase, partial [Actinobacteria bacterium]|nr:LLM class flavin-dependent oxidoreductase [Actinomycetota bacterium]
PDELVARRARLDAACEAVGRDPGTLGLSMMTTFVAGNDQHEIDRRMRAACEIAGSEWEAQIANWLVGTPAQIAERLAELDGARVERVFLKTLDHGDLEAVAALGEIARMVP